MTLFFFNLIFYYWRLDVLLVGLFLAFSIIFGTFQLLVKFAKLFNKLIFRGSKARDQMINDVTRVSNTRVASTGNLMQKKNHPCGTRDSQTRVTAVLQIGDLVLAVLKILLLLLCLLLFPRFLFVFRSPNPSSSSSHILLLLRSLVIFFFRFPCSLYRARV